MSSSYRPPDQDVPQLFPRIFCFSPSRLFAQLFFRTPDVQYGFPSRIVSRWRHFVHSALCVIENQLRAIVHRSDAVGEYGSKMYAFGRKG